MSGRWSGALLLALIGVHHAAPPARAGENEPLRILSAASLTEVVGAIGVDFTTARVETALGGSSALARQIRDGAPADVFLSASAEWIAFLDEADALAGPAVVFARNRLVCVAPAGGRLAEQVRDARDLLDRIGPDGRVAIADDGVPAGEYARSALRHLDLLSAFERRLVGQKDVRAVLHAVELGEVDAGFVYATDARVAAVRVLFDFAQAAHPEVEYFAAVVRTAANPAAARRFVDRLSSASVQRQLAAAGFGTP